jgi:hypothetical protein
MAWHMTTLDT